jgi:chromate reductase
VGDSIGAIGTARARYHRRQIMFFFDMFPISQPEVIIGNAATQFEKKGNLMDEPTSEYIRKQHAALVTWTRRLK